MIILAFLAIGLSAGWVAQAVLTPRRRRDWPRALAAGSIGSLVGGLIASLLAGDGLDLRLSGIVGSIIGALIVTALWESLGKPGTASRSNARG